MGVFTMGAGTRDVSMETHATLMQKEWSKVVSGRMANGKESGLLRMLKMHEFVKLIKNTKDQQIWVV